MQTDSCMLNVLPKIASWTGYVCVFLLLALGCDLLLSANIMTSENPEYGAKKQAEILIENTPIKRIFALERSSGSRHLYVDIPPFDGESIGDTFVTPSNYISRRVSIPSVEVDGDRREAWKKILTPQKS